MSGYLRSRFPDVATHVRRVLQLHTRIAELEATSERRALSEYESVELLSLLPSEEYGLGKIDELTWRELEDAAGLLPE